MSEASERTLAWREQKRQDGYQPVTIWIPARVKNDMVNFAFQRHQDLGEVIVDAWQLLAHAKGSKTAVPLPPAPEGQKRCQKGHAPYPASKPECPQCARERKQAYRQRKADKRRGEDSRVTTLAPTRAMAVCEI